jgi:beta-glucanase (GH16 family)
MRVRLKTCVRGPARTQRRNGFKRTMAALCGVLVVATLGALGVAANGSSDSALVTTKFAATVSAPKGWRLAFISDFSGSNINTKVWGECYPWANPSQGCTNFGNVNEEKEWYTESQIHVKNGVLDLVASPKSTAGYNERGGSKVYDCTSGMVTTFPSFDFTYGFVQITARIPFGRDLWPAFWLVPQSWQWPPEIDILEHWGTSSTARATLRPKGLPQQYSVVPARGINHGWHTFTLSWTKTRLTWWYDGKQVLTTTIGVPQQPMYLILNLAVDNASPGGCNGMLKVKSVKIWVSPGD